MVHKILTTAQHAHHRLANHHRVSGDPQASRRGARTERLLCCCTYSFSSTILFWTIIINKTISSPLFINVYSSRSYNSLFNAISVIYLGFAGERNIECRSGNIGAARSREAPILTSYFQSSNPGQAEIYFRGDSVLSWKLPLWKIHVSLCRLKRSYRDVAHSATH